MTFLLSKKQIRTIKAIGFKFWFSHYHFLSFVLSTQNNLEKRLIVKPLTFLHVKNDGSCLNIFFIDDNYGIYLPENLSHEMAH